jgi:hypothetical protein
MADEKISALDAKTTLADTDLIPIMDEEATPDQTKHITGTDLKSAITRRSSAQIIAANDSYIKTQADLVCDGTDD